MKKNRSFFTLLEVVISLSILLIITIVLTYSFNAIHKTAARSKSENEILQNARIALDIMSKDIQCIYYASKATAFYHKGKENNPADIYNNDLLCFISETPMPPSGSTSNVCEIKYQLYSTSESDLRNDSSAGMLRRSVTGDNSSKWNFLNKDSNKYYDYNSSDYAFTADNSSSEDYADLIPYVTDLNFTCYSREDSTAEKIISGTEADSKTFPYSIDIELKMLDKNTWNKWITNPTANKELRYKFERTFTKSVLIGDRGQYD